MAENTVTTLSDFPTMFNDVEIPFFYGSESYEKVQNSSLSESGKDFIQIVRNSKLSISCEFNLADVAWVKTFREFSLLPSFTLRLYDVVSDNYATYTVRIEDYKHSRRRKSEDLTEVKGVWNVSFTIKEF